MKRLGLILLLTALWTANEWQDWRWLPIPPYPGHVLAQARAQAPYPPNPFHPYRGAANCIQFWDGTAQGNFSCDPLVTVNTTTHTISSIISSTSGGPLVVGNASAVVALGTDLVIQKASYSSVAAIGPGVGDGITLRVRPSTRTPGYCQLVAIAGNSFGVEYPVAFIGPPLLSGGDYRTGANANLFDVVTFEIPGGPGGC